MGPRREKQPAPSSPAREGKGPRLSARGTSHCSLQFKIGREDACQDPVRSWQTGGLYFWLCTVKHQGRLPKPTADSGCDDKTILRVGWGPASRGSPSVSSGGVIPTRALGAGRWLYKGAQGAGSPLAPAAAHTHAGLCTHLPRINIPACHSLAWNGLPHPAAITIPSHLLPEA